SSTSGVRKTSETGCRSFIVSKGIDLYSVGLDANELGEASSVAPSGVDLATKLVAITPPAPGLFSTTTALPIRPCNFVPTARMIASVLPPAGNDTMNLMVPVGNSSARAANPSGINPPTVIEATRSDHRVSISSSLYLLYLSVTSFLMCACQPLAKYWS